MTYLTFQNKLFSLRIIHFLIYLHQKYQFSYVKTMCAQNVFFVVVPFLCTGMWVSAHRILSNSFNMYKKNCFLYSSTLLPPPKFVKISYTLPGGLDLLTGVWLSAHPHFIKCIHFLQNRCFLVTVLHFYHSQYLPKSYKFSHTLPSPVTPNSPT